MNDFSFITKQLDRMEEKINVLDSRIDSGNILSTKQGSILERNTDSLIEHIKRTELLEKRADNIEKHIVKVETITSVSLKLGGWIIFGIGALWSLYTTLVVK